MSYAQDRQAYKYFCQEQFVPNIRLNSSHDTILQAFEEVAIKCYPMIKNHHVIVRTIQKYSEQGGQAVIDVLDDIARQIREDRELIEIENLKKATVIKSVKFHESYDNGTVVVDGFAGDDEFRFIKENGIVYCGCIYTDAEAYRYSCLSHQISQEYKDFLTQMLDEAVKEFVSKDYTTSENGQFELFATEDKQLALF